MVYHGGNQLLDPYLLFEKAQLREGMHAAVFGTGRTGHLVFPAARIVGERGAVYAVDILKDVLQEVHKRAMLDNLPNIHTVWADVERPGTTTIPEGTVDVVFMVNLLVHLKNREAPLAEAERLLKAKGRTIIVDWVDTSAFKMKRELVRFEEVVTWAGKLEFVVQEDFSAGKYHRGIVLFRHE